MTIDAYGFVMGEVTHEVTCQECGATHPATPSHEGQHGEGLIYAVVCDADSLTDYYTSETVRRVKRTDWRAMRERAFNTEAPDQPLALFPEPDRTGTPDLFAEEQDA